jgi:ATP-dependent RNA helicase DeaD
MLININEKSQLNRIAAHYKIEFEKRPLPQDEDVQSLVAQRLVGQLEARLRARDKLQIDRMQRFFPLVKELADDDDGLALLAMLLDDSYHAWMHQPPEVPPAASTTPTQKPSRRDRKSRYRRGKRKKRSSARKSPSN